MSEQLSRKPQVINIKGLPFTGKSVLARTIVSIEKDWRRSDADLLDVDAATRAYARRAQLPLHTRNDYVRAERQRASRNLTVVSRVLELHEDGSPLIVIDGLEDYGQANALQSLYGNSYHTLVLEDSDEARLTRAQKCIPKIALATTAQFKPRFPTSTAALLSYETDPFVDETEAEDTIRMTSGVAPNISYVPSLSQMGIAKVAEAVLSGVRATSMQG